MTTSLGPLVLDLQAEQLSQEERELIAHPLVGGVILFTRNYQNKQQLRELCHDVRQLKGEHQPILIMVDQEGGRVQRFVSEFTTLPALAHYGEVFEREPELACELAHTTASVMAQELLDVGIDFSISPVLDLNKGKNTVIGNRAFHRHPDVVSTLGQHFIEGMQKVGMASLAKHFPGHGSVTADSHHELPIDQRTFAELQEDDLVPFQNLAHLVNGMMASHLLFPAIDSNIVGFSPYWLKNILRDKMQFKGVILSDDLHMQGANISDYAPDRFQAARDAGCDLALYCNDRKGVIQIIDHTTYTAHMLPESTWRQLKANINVR